MITDTDLSIIFTRKTEVSIWQKIWEQCPWATFFESPEWADVFERSFGDVYESHALEIGFSDGVIAIVPGVTGKRIRGKIRILECSPGGTYGGPISTDSLHEKHIELIVKEVKSQFQGIYMNLNPYLIQRWGNKKYPEADFTQVIDLQQTDEQIATLFKKKKIATYAGKIRELGFEIRPAAPDQLATFYDIYKEALSRWEKISRIYPLDFFKYMLECKHCDFWGCYDSNGEMVGGGLFVRSNHHVISWLSLIRPEYMKKRVFDFFYYEIIFNYRKKGVKYFDFNPSGGNKGVVQFKDKFHPDRLPVPVFAEKSLLVKTVDSLNKFIRRNE